uniref:Ig-like domain-containing protein n=1 Tax=Scleropages formosus TaxID=113540 RepID=A0A8C9UXH5_SCLFO
MSLSFSFFGSKYSSRPLRPSIKHIVLDNGKYKNRNTMHIHSNVIDIVQSNVVVTAQSGDSVTLTCDSTSFSYSSAVWFRHVAGQKTQFILATYQHSTDYAFYNGFNDTQRFTLQRKHNMFNLRISGTSTSDSGFYYCAFYAVFSKFAILVLISIYTVRPGDSVTLQCTVDSETCAGEHSVYWFRHGSGESLPGLIYTHGNRRDECEKSPEAGSPTHSCVYSLPKRNLSRSDAGIYYCAVVTCEDILFGNGTQLDIEGKSKLNVSHSKSFILNVTAQITIWHIYSIQPGNTGRKARGGGDTPRTGRQSIARHPKRD